MTAIQMKKASGRSRLLLAVNIALSALILAAIAALLPKPKRQRGIGRAASEAASREKAVLPAELTEETTHSSGSEDVRPSAGDDQGGYGGEAFQRTVNRHLSRQSRALIEELDSAVENGRTNDSLALSLDDIKELEEKSVMIH